MVLFCICSGNGNADDETQKMKPSFVEWQRLRSAYSAYVGLFYPTDWYNTLKNLLNHAYVRLFPPDIDFRIKEKGTAKSAAETVVNVKNSLSQSDADTKTHEEL
ncbi:hypothetical protein LR48_Vigan406s002700 [Vigna angularis]|uniref:Uncharacterized protein n=1 Tax=Phaseolus angularis TaxID=3914 RepID=A0A0L9T9H9_PHAAN|nr:hypothetical protein LR48_Vigan406s002700 [Vigna angularis]